MAAAQDKMKRFNVRSMDIDIIFSNSAILLKNPDRRLLKKISEARRAKIDERRRTLVR